MIRQPVTSGTWPQPQWALSNPFIPRPLHQLVHRQAIISSSMRICESCVQLSPIAVTASSDFLALAMDASLLGQMYGVP